jgi:ribosomal-protein-alanine N-acetyltransferase
MHAMETERLLLRPFTMDDLDALHRTVYGDPENRWSKGGRTREYTQEVLTLKVHGLGTFGSLAIECRHDSTLMGFVDLSPFVTSWIVFEDAADSPYCSLEVELAYVLGREYWGNGYATEACRAMIGYTFEVLKLPRIVNSIAPDNIRSINVVKRLGYYPVNNLDPDDSAPVWILDNDQIRE